MKQLTDDVIPEQAEFEEEERRTHGDIPAAIGQAQVATATSGPTHQTFRQPSSHEQPPVPQTVPPQQQ